MHIILTSAQVASRSTRCAKKARWPLSAWLVSIFSLKYRIPHAKILKLHFHLCKIPSMPYSLTVALRKHAHAIYRIFFSKAKIEDFHWKKFDIFNNFAQNIDCGYTLEPPRRGGRCDSNEYPQSMFWIKNKYTPAYPIFTLCM